MIEKDEIKIEIEMTEGEEISFDTLEELSNGKGEGEE